MHNPVFDPLDIIAAGNEGVATLLGKLDATAKVHYSNYIIILSVMISQSLNYSR